MEKKLNGTALKWIALITMFIDHTTVVFLQSDCIPASGLLITLLRGIGRLSFPIYAFLLVEGFQHTKNKARYFLRLLLFSFLSEVPFDRALYGKWVDLSHQNVFFTLSLGLGMLIVCQKITEKFSFANIENEGRSEEIRALFMLVVVAIFCGLAILLSSDYSFIGILVIALFYFLRNQERYRFFASMLLLAGFDLLELFALPDFLFFHFYNGERGKGGKKLQYFFYLFYPLHLSILFIVRYILFGK